MTAENSENSWDDALVGHVAALPAVCEAARAAAGLIELWPLTDAMRMDNDVKYAENLQVRITRMMAALMTGEDVTMPDAEYVYEGADVIPGRPQPIVDALLAANDAYDAMADYSDTGDVTLVMQAVALLAGAAGSAGNGVSADDTQVRAALESVETAIAPKAVDDGHVPPSADPDEIAHRFAIVVVACGRLMRALAENQTALPDAARAALPVILYANELGERLSIPRVYLDADGFRDLVAIGVRPDADLAAAVQAMVGRLAPAAADEWNRHREDVLWDPEEAKKRAKEEDERKSKEALAAKFAHVKDDPNKEQVEL